MAKKNKDRRNEDLQNEEDRFDEPSKDEFKGHRNNKKFKRDEEKKNRKESSWN